MSKIYLIMSLILIACPVGTDNNEMKTLEKYLVDIPRFENARISEQEKFEFKNYKTFYVYPENTPPIGRAIFMVKNDQVFPTHKREFFPNLIKDLSESGELMNCDVIKFSELFLKIGQQKDAKIIDTEQMAHRYRKNFEGRNWTKPRATTTSNARRFQFWAIDLSRNKAYYYNILIDNEGKLEVKEFN